jgi:hypothetical protein
MSIFNQSTARIIPKARKNWAFHPSVEAACVRREELRRLRMQRIEDVCLGAALFIVLTGTKPTIIDDDPQEAPPRARVEPKAKPASLTKTQQLLASLDVIL